MSASSGCVVTFNGELSPEQWRALKAQGIEATDQGPPTGAPSVLVEGEGEAQAAYLVVVILEPLGDFPEIETHPLPRESREADEAFAHYLAIWDGLADDTLRAERMREVLKWALKTYGPPDYEDEGSIAAWAVVKALGAAGAREALDEEARDSQIAEQEIEDFMRRWDRGELPWSSD